MQERTTDADAFLSLLHRACLLAIQAMRSKAKASIMTIPYFFEDIACRRTGRAYPDGCGSAVTLMSWATRF